MEERTEVPLETTRRSPFATSFQFREDERAGLTALFERVFFDRAFSAAAKEALLRTQYVAAGAQRAADADSSADEAAALPAAVVPSEFADHRRYVFLYRGPNGIGKTRIFRQFVDSAQTKELPVYEVFTHDVEGIPFKPFLHAIRAILRDHDRGQALQEKYRFALEGFIPELFPDEQGEELDPITRERLDAEKVRLYDGITQLLLEVSTRRPLLLLVHDLHWSDVPTIELLSYIGRNLRLRNDVGGGADVDVTFSQAADLSTFEGDEEEWRGLTPSQPQSGDHLSNLLQLSQARQRQDTRPPARVMILASYRASPDPDHYLDQAINRLGASDFAYHGDLRPLRETEAAAFVARAVEGVNLNGRSIEVSPEAVEAMYEASEGFPSFLHELLNALYLSERDPVENGGVVRWSGETVLELLGAANSGNAPPPSTESRETQTESTGLARRCDVLKLRLRGASTEEMLVLKVLATARRPLTAEVVAGVLTGALLDDAQAFDPSDTPELLEHLARRGLIERHLGNHGASGTRGTTARTLDVAASPDVSDASYFFHLWDYVDVVAEMISDEERRILHQRIGEQCRDTLEQQSAESTFEVFYHLYRGVDPRASAGYGLSAARWFLRSLSLEKAREIYEDLLGLITADDDIEERVAIVERQARISLALNDVEHAEKLLRRVAEEGGGRLAPERSLELLLLEAEAAGRRDPAKGIKVLGKSSRLLKNENSRLGVRTQLLLARLRLWRQDIKRAINLCLKGRDLCIKLGKLPELGDFYREMANAFYQKGDYAHAVDNYQRALNEFEAQKLKSRQVAVLDDLGRVYLERGNYFRAARYLYRSLEIRRSDHDVAGLCRSYDQLGKVYLRSGDYFKTIENLNLSLSLKERIGDFPGLNPTLNTLGDLYARLGLYQSSIEYFRRAVANSEALGDTRGLVEAFANLGRCSFELGDFKQAASFAKQVGILSSEFKLRLEEADGLLLQGCRDGLDREWADAEKRLKQAVEIYAKLGNRRREASAYLEQAEIKLQRELFDEALKIVSKGHVIAEDLKALDLQVRALVIKGNIHRFLKGGNVDRAREFFQKALELSQNFGDVGLLFSLFYSFAKLCHGERDFSEAANYYSKAELILKQIGNNLTEDLAARFMEDRRRKVFTEDLARFRRESVGRDSGAAVDLRGAEVVSRSVKDRPIGVGDYKDLQSRVLRLHAGMNQLHFYERILDDALELSGADRGFVLQVQNRQYTPVAFHGFGKQATQHPEYMVANQLAQESVRKGRSIVASGAKAGTDDARGDRQLQLGYLVHRSILTVPFLTDERIFGGVYLDKPVSLGEFGARDQVLLEAFAHHAAVALNNRREFEIAIREPLTGFYTPSYFIDRLGDAYRLYNLHDKAFALVGFYLPNLDDMLADGRGQLGSNLLRELSEVLAPRTAVCWGSPVLYLLLEDGDVPLMEDIAVRVRERLAQTLNDDVAMELNVSNRQYRSGSDIYFQIRQRLLPAECDHRTLSALRSVLASDVTLRDSKRIVEKHKIESTLRKTGGNITHAARELGIHRPQLSNLLKKYKLKRELFESNGDSGNGVGDSEA